MCTARYIAIAFAFLLLVLTSGKVVKGILQIVAHKPIADIATEDKPEEGAKRRLDIGGIIGKCENIMILAFLILGSLYRHCDCYNGKDNGKKGRDRKEQYVFPGWNYGKCYLLRADRVYFKNGVTIYNVLTDK